MKINFMNLLDYVDKNMTILLPIALPICISGIILKVFIYKPLKIIYNYILNFNNKNNENNNDEIIPKAEAVYVYQYINLIEYRFEIE
jgi:hypothetical protein